ncbi:hypothetical protein [Comamonas sp. 26]|uniref:hypothetical protein n=1 Tax=Comamonas sp. 26 TaxID=2035201 RepID=UPI001E510EFB|nr:hypothetical protein [Comamonas sp. 26]
MVSPAKGCSAAKMTTVGRTTMGEATFMTAMAAMLRKGRTRAGQEKCASEQPA